MLNYKILHKQFWENEFQDMLKEYLENQMPYVRESYFDNWTYISRDLLLLNENEWLNFIQNNIMILNEEILKKAVYYLLKQDQLWLERIWITNNMKEVIIHAFNNQKTSSYKDLLLTHYWRYDLLLDTENKLKIVEINSETPAWFPESSNNDIILRNAWLYHTYKDINANIFNNIEVSLKRFIEKTKNNSSKNFLFTFLPANSETLQVYETKEWYLDIKWSYDDDYTCSLHMSAMFYDILTKYGYNVKMWNITDIEVKEDWLYYLWEKQDFLYSFYPLEWIFEDEWSEDFWNLYKDNKFIIVNNPINLITQSKWIWAYIHEDIKNWNKIWLTEEEINIFLDLVPEYKFHINENEIEDYVSKPFFFREWVWIDNKDYAKEFPDKICYQKKIQQKIINVNTFSFEEAEEWYLTLWVYVWDNTYIWAYTRFCADYITNDNAYYLPIVFL